MDKPILKDIIESQENNLKSLEQKLKEMGSTTHNEIKPSDFPSEAVVPRLLREIRDELRKITSLLEKK